MAACGLAYHDTRPVPNPSALNRSTVHGMQCTLLFFLQQSIVQSLRVILLITRYS